MSSCESGLPGGALYRGEDMLMVVRIATTLISFTATSSWFSREKIARLDLFFAHWLAGLVAGLGHIVESTMVAACWTGSDLEGFIKAIKFIELSAFNMFAVTNLAISVNLALIVSSHRTMTRVKSVSSPRLLVAFMIISMLLAIPVLLLAELTFVSGTAFHVANADQGVNKLIGVSFFYVEFFVGICMVAIVAWLLLFRMNEVKGCWKTHARIRFYFGLTLVGIAANLSIGICGMINVVDSVYRILLTVWSWTFRYVHVALDTFVLYGVLQERNMDKRPGGGGTSSAGSGGSGNKSRPVATTSSV